MIGEAVSTVSQVPPSRLEGSGFAHAEVQLFAAHSALRR